MTRFQVGDKVVPNEHAIARLKQVAEEYPMTMGDEIESALNNTPWTVGSVRESGFGSSRLNTYMFKESVYIGCSESELEWGWESQWG